MDVDVDVDADSLMCSALFGSAQLCCGRAVPRGSQARADTQLLSLPDRDIIECFVVSYDCEKSKRKGVATPATISNCQRSSR